MLHTARQLPGGFFFFFFAVNIAATPPGFCGDGPEDRRRPSRKVDAAKLRYGPLLPAPALGPSPFPDISEKCRLPALNPTPA
jgi:hypothetical protein